jgi:hypothetical protein
MPPEEKHPMSDIYEERQKNQQTGRFLQWHDLFPQQSQVNHNLLHAVEEGLRRGVGRCAENALGDTEQHRRAVRHTIDLLTTGELPRSTWTLRGVTLFVELLTTANCVRFTSGKAPIQAADVEKYATYTEDFLNCWFCL